MKIFNRSDARAKVGDTVVIGGFKCDDDGSLPQSERSLIGKTGKVTLVDDAGAIHGTWGGISLLPCDDYHVIEKGR